MSIILSVYNQKGKASQYHALLICPREEGKTVTIVVAYAAIQINLGLYDLAILAAHQAAQETAVVEAEGLHFAGLMEVASHFFGRVFFFSLVNGGLKKVRGGGEGR